MEDNNVIDRVSKEANFKSVTPVAYSSGTLYLLSDFGELQQSILQVTNYLNNNKLGISFAQLLHKNISVSLNGNSNSELVVRDYELKMYFQSLTSEKLQEIQNEIINNTQKFYSIVEQEEAKKDSQSKAL